MFWEVQVIVSLRVTAQERVCSAQLHSVSLTKQVSVSCSLNLNQTPFKILPFLGRADLQIGGGLRSNQH